MAFKGVKMAFSRQGYEADIKLMSQANPEHCVEALTGTSFKNEPLDRLAYNEAIPPALRALLKQVMIATVNVPFTDGYKRQLRHESHNLNA
eukprot:11102490-Karenia_brevis.AAC.1